MTGKLVKLGTNINYLGIGRKGPSMTTTATTEAMSPSELISDQINGLTDWRADLLARIRDLIKAAAPDITE